MQVKLLAKAIGMMSKKGDDEVKKDDEDKNRCQN